MYVSNTVFSYSLVASSSPIAKGDSEVRRNAPRHRQQYFITFLHFMTFLPDSSLTTANDIFPFSCIYAHEDSMLQPEEYGRELGPVTPRARYSTV